MAEPNRICMQSACEEINELHSPVLGNGGERPCNCRAMFQPY